MKYPNNGHLSFVERLSSLLECTIYNCMYLSFLERFILFQSVNDWPSRLAIVRVNGIIAISCLMKLLSFTDRYRCCMP